MSNQVETQMERSQGTSIQQNSMHYLPRTERGGGGGGGGGGGSMITAPHPNFSH